MEALEIMGKGSEEFEISDQEAGLLTPPQVIRVVMVRSTEELREEERRG